MQKRRYLIFLFLVLFLSFFTIANAQSYYFQVPKLTLDVFWEPDGTLILNYVFVFNNEPSGHSIEYVDLGLPNSNYSDGNITAFVDGNQVFDISSSGYQGEGGSGVAVGLGEYSITPGDSGTVQIQIVGIRDTLYYDSQEDNYASAVFGTSYFDSSYVAGTTDYTVTYHLPPGVEPEQPRWHSAPQGFPSEPAAGFDDQGRITYTWHNPDANAYTQYEFGASFPIEYIPPETIVTVNPYAGIIDFLRAAIVPLLCIGIFVVIVVAGLASDNRRKRQYLPPKISIEGHGIKRGLTAVEAAILLEEPLDKVLTMVLFSVIKKNAAEVTARDPLELKVIQPSPESLQSYEVDFLDAFHKKASDRKKVLREMVLSLVKSVSEKMKGFSRQETVAYYRDIIKRAWDQVEAADTPEVKSQKYEEVMEWTMLDKNYGDRTEEVFRHSPVFIPTWWGRYDPGYGRMPGKPSSVPVPTASGSPGVPGSDFAASLARGVETFSSKVVGNINDFTSSITSVTNPPPKVSSSTYKGGSGSGGGRSCACACACACAGCACACAGGGR